MKVMVDEQLLDLSAVVRQLMAKNIITPDQAEEVLARPRASSQSRLHPLEFVAGHGFTRHDGSDRPLDLDYLSRWLAEWAGQPLYHIDPLKVDVQRVIPLMSQAFAERHQILALEMDDETVTIASAQPFMRGWEENLRHVLRREIKRVVANPADIRRYSAEFFKLSQSVSHAVGEDAGHSRTLGNFEQLLELGNLQAPDANDQHIVNIVDWLLQYAFEQRASDIHIEPRREQGKVRFRIDGVLHNVYDFPAKVNAAVTSRIKILGRMNVAEKRKPQDGRLKTKSLEGNEVELRLSTLPTAFGEKLVMRVFDPDVLLKSFSELGLGREDNVRWQGMINQPNGIVLVTGPTGSGKTTTLYSSLKALATSEVNVCSIEDPIEMVEPAFNQMQVHHSIGLDFASGVRALMRQDPDIIMIGEIRDLETAEMAMQAALTGHLVLSTLHTNDAPSAVSRLLELGIPPYMVKSTINGVMAQRLVRTLCPLCKRSAEVDQAAWRSLTRPWKLPPPKQMFEPVGCDECRQTGYRGRAGVYEIMPLVDNLKELIDERCDLAALRRQAFREGMKSLRLSGAQKVAQGVTTIAEVLRVTPEQERDRSAEVRE
ncbi:GspE/PulE family protein [Aestuariirhabdus litorea]|uniref:Type II/IV secretion system protein n=1 Tax=Aestuariirhabdus litorea TaxID=2528527 RepID=A0A3P3VI19_9GAMM|nr:GspE/PulE family protein [Aestuariirhabdus litorea]RRJ82371.1 type II/IV secretion system protein [Aestuariirhabdus litorea]RWW92534.1 type II/IV secretion system protein [Endozoicomonadaceae bacterium GTF-13]